MKDSIPDGVPLVSDYKAVADSDVFKAMEQYSANFLSANDAVFKNYTKKWVRDPLHQWSRQWEYPYVYDRIRKGTRDIKTPRILDAGSGITFFPHYLNAEINNAAIHCCDYDETIAMVFEQLNAGKEQPVEFVSADLRTLPYASESFNAVYCISVLEHTDGFEKIIKELSRVLVPGGVMVITFDISMDGTRDIDLDRAETLLSSLSRIVKKEETPSHNLRVQLSSPDIFTTLTAHEIDVDLLPWTPPPMLWGRIKAFVSSGRFTWPPPLTVYCLSLTKCS